MTLWHGRFASGPADELLAFTVSLSFDQRLAPDDIAGVAGPRRGARAGRSARRRRGRAVLAALDQVGDELADGTFAFAPTDEDIHTAIERRVTELAGAAGAKLHTGRSRNDQVATDLRLYLKREGADVARPGPGAAGGAARAGRGRAATTLPARLHPPAAGPARAAGAPPAGPRLGASRATSTAGATRSTRADVSPLGAGALAGSSLPLDPDGVAADLGFAAALRQLPRRGERPRLRRRGAVRPRAPRCTCRAWARRSCCGRPRSSASSGSPTRTPPAARCCRRRRTPTSPSSRGARPAGSSATSPACSPR